MINDEDLEQGAAEGFSSKQSYVSKETEIALRDAKKKLAEMISRPSGQLNEVWLRMMADYWESKKLMEQTYGESQMAYGNLSKAAGYEEQNSILKDKIKIAEEEIKALENQNISSDEENNEVDELAETSRDKVTRSKMTKSDLEKEFERDRKKKNKVTFEN